MPDPGSSQSLNRYSYVNSNPLVYADPSGHILDRGGDGFGGPPVCIGRYCGDTSGATLNDEGRAFVETSAEMVCSLNDYCDMAISGARIASGKAGPIEVLFAATPILPGILGKYLDEAVDFFRRHGDEVFDFVKKIFRIGETAEDLSRPVLEADYLLTIGKQGRSFRVRELSGDAETAKRFFKELTEGTTVVPHPDPNLAAQGGLFATLPDGIGVGFRPTSTSGPPTVDIHNLPGLPTRFEIKFTAAQ